MPKELRMFAVALSPSERNIVLIISDQVEADILSQCGPGSKLLDSKILRHGKSFRLLAKVFPSLIQTLDQVFEFAICLAFKRR